MPTTTGTPPTKTPPDKHPAGFSHPAPSASTTPHSSASSAPGNTHEAAPAAADVVGGGVLGGGEAAFGAGAAGVGAAPGGGGVVMFLRGLGEHLRRDGDRLLRAAGLGVLRGLQDLRAVPVQGHR